MVGGGDGGVIVTAGGAGGGASVTLTLVSCVKASLKTHFTNKSLLLLDFKDTVEYRR